MTSQRRQVPFLQVPARAHHFVPGGAVMGQGMHPAVSVVMSVHNRTRYCAEAIDSILGQTLADFEFIIVDDGSTDGTSAFLEWYCGLDARIRLLRSETNRGISVSMNLAIAQARCDLIARMDSDDVALPQRLEHQVAFMAKHPAILAAGTALQVIDANGALIGQPSRVEADPGILRNCPRLAHPTTMLRREAVRRIGGYRRAFDHAEDLDLWFRLGEIGELGNIPEVLLHYRNHAGNVHQTHRRRQAFLAEMAALAARRRRTGWGDPVEADRHYEEDEMADLLGWPEEARSAFVRGIEG